MHNGRYTARTLLHRVVRLESDGDKSDFASRKMVTMYLAIIRGHHVKIHNGQVMPLQTMDIIRVHFSHQHEMYQLGRWVMGFSTDMHRTFKTLGTVIQTMDVTTDNQVVLVLEFSQIVRAE